MKVDILTLFPESFGDTLNTSIISRAIAQKALAVGITDFRNYTDNKHRQVDDYAYGGFAGMVIQPEALYSALIDLTQDNFAPVIYFTPQGRKLEQSILEYYVQLPRVILICGHYKEIDQRLRDLAVSDEISLGDYVLSGGELPAMIFLDGIARLLPGVLTDITSATADSFSSGQHGLGFPCYTRPERWMDLSVPDELRNGNHKKIKQWSDEYSESLTKIRRPDLVK